MITFLPNASFKLSAMSLDSQRLGKQRVEVKQILIAIYWDEIKKSPMLAEQVLTDMTVLSRPRYGNIAKHPACLMWAAYPAALIAYGMYVCQEWTNRGNADRVYASLEAFADLSESIYPQQEWMAANVPNLLPPWLNDERLHSSHRSNLIRKYPEYYRVLGWTESPNLDYFWPHEHPDYHEENNRPQGSRYRQSEK